MAFGGDDDIKITLSLEADGVVKELKLVGESLEKIEQASGNADRPVKGLESAFSSLGAAVVSINQGLELAGRAFGVIQTVGGAAIDAIKRGAEVSDVTESFERLTAAAGVTASTFQNELVQATGETISNFDLQKKAIESLRAGVKPDEFITLTQAARALAEQTGGDTKEAIDELSTAFETGRVRGLQNKLGIIDLQAAEENLANSLGVSSEQLTEQGRVLAARNALLEASRKKVAEVGKIEADAGDNIDRLGAILDNTKNKFFDALAQNEDLNRALKTLAEIALRIDFGPIISGLSNIASKAVQAAEALLRVAAAAAKAFNTTPGPVQAFENSLSTLEEFSRKLKAVQEELKNVGNSRASFEKLKPSIVELEKEYGKLYSQLKGSNGLTEAYKQIIQTANGLDLALKQNEDSSKDTGRAFDDLVRKVEKGVEKTKPLDDPFGIEAILKEVEKTLGKAEEEIKRIEDEIAKEQFAQGEKIGSFLVQGLDAALSGDKGALKDFAKDLGSELGAEAGTAIGESIGGPLGAGIGRQIGAFVGEKLGKAAFDALNSVFGGRDKQGKVRDSLDKFFGELLTDNPALINFEGRLKEIFDLEFLRGTNAFTDGTFDDTLQSLSTSAQATFSGLALAFSQFVEGASDQSGQLAAILANNLGGSLNNLQLFVQATGMSFEKLREQIVEAFLDGKLTADEALNSLSSIQQIAEKGIPGALGAVDQAFNNLKASGEKGGRAIIDALQDIGSEARELGVKDFGTLANVIREKTGASAEEVQKLFDALTAAGITSIDQLENATVEQLLPAISNLSKAEFPFAEAADSVQGLIDQVNRLPDRIEKKLVFNVETRADRASQQLIDKGAIPQFGNAGEGT